MPFNRDYAFDTYVSAITNKFAYNACLGFAEASKPSSNPLFLYGPTSAGKTHLLHAIANHTNRILPKKKIIFTSAEVMIHELNEALNRDQIIQFRERYTTADLLLVDDIHILSGKESTQAEFFHIFDTLMRNGGRLAMAGLKRPADIQHFSSYLKSNLKNCLMLPLKPPSRYELELILTRKFAATLPTVSYSLIQRALQQGKNADVRRAVGMVNQLTFAGSQAGFSAI